MAGTQSAPSRQSPPSSREPRQPYGGTGKDTTVEAAAVEPVPKGLPSTPASIRRRAAATSARREATVVTEAGATGPARRRSTVADPTGSRLPRRRRRYGNSGLLLLGITILLAVIAFLLFGESGLTISLGEVPVTD